MGRIYRHVEDVVVWLGEATSTWKTAIQYMQKLDLAIDLELFSTETMVEALIGAHLSDD